MLLPIETVVHWIKDTKLFKLAHLHSAGPPCVVLGWVGLVWFPPEEKKPVCGQASVAS